MNAGAVTIVVMSFTAPPPPFAPLRGGRRWLGHRLRQSAEDTVAGRGGLRWRLDVHWVVVLDVPYPELASYRISQLGRLRPPAMPCLKCFRCFKNMFQLFQINVVFHLDVAKVDLDIAYVAMAIYACCKHMFEVFQVFQTYVLSVSSGCCKNRSGCCICCYGHTRMFQVF